MLKQKKLHTDNFSLFAAKNFYQPKNRSDLLISFVMKKKIGNAVKRNRIKRKLKAIVQGAGREINIHKIQFEICILNKNILNLKQNCTDIVKKIRAKRMI